ncbi:hypothetical protein AcW1_003888 [Taiwanofungus camphoratus]|nr:hypothetical protein AcW1_003888 [Antrodia cinnamomea]
MFSEDSDAENIHEPTLNDNIHSLTINEYYAKAYEYRKEREELAKLKEKYGADLDEEDVDEDDSEEAESEDEDGEDLTPAVDAAILRTLARIRRKDPSIYEQDKDIFEEERRKTGDAAPLSRVPKDKSKPVTIRQHALASALNPDSRTPSPEPLTHAEEQVALRKETISAFHTAVTKSEDDDDFLVPREKTKDELEREEEEYRAFLEREVGEELKEIVTVESTSAMVDIQDEADQKEAKKKNKKNKTKAKKSKQEEDQEFLLNYILNRGWIDRSTRRLPTYKEITSSKTKGKGKAKEDQSDVDTASGYDDENRRASESEESDGKPGNEELDEDEFDEIVDRFESSYNFRFEEPGADSIARYPRNLPSLVRRQDTSRKEARDKRKARKEEELLKKKEEVKRLKALKLKDLRARLEKIGKEGGKSLEDNKALQELDLDGDWDPEAHDRQMAQLYENDAHGDVEDEKPQWDDDIDIDDIIPREEEGLQTRGGKAKKSKKKKKKENGDEIDDGVDVEEMDANVVHLRADDEEWDGTEEMRKRKLEEYMDEAYGLEFNDMVGDLPTRFKYTKVAPQTFGLASTEILLATDAELNSYVGIKKYAPYRKEGKGKHWDNTRTTRLKELKAKLLDRGVVSQGGKAEIAGEKPKKRKGKKERMKERALAMVPAAADDQQEDNSIAEVMTNGRKENIKRKALEMDEDEDKDDSTADVPIKKKRRRHKKFEHTAS